MKNLILLIVAIFIATSAFSQQKEDVVYLKNGSIIKGEIVYLVPDKDIVIKTSDGQLYTFNFIDVEQIERPQEINLNEYGGKASYGVALGGSGLVSVPIRIFPSPNFAIEFTPGFIPIPDQQTSFIVSIGSNFYMTKYYNPLKHKVKLNGITIKGSAAIWGTYYYTFSVNWIHENFKLQLFDKSFSFELGPGIFIIPESNPKIYLGPFWKFQWNFFGK